MIIPDVNLLVYAHNTAIPEHQSAKSWLESVIAGPETLGLTWVSLLGFVRLLSSPQVVPHPDPPQLLLKIVAGMISQPRVRIVVPGIQHVGLMEQLFQESGGGSRLVTDVHLAALAIEHGATLASNDSDFGRFTGLKWFNPV